MENKRTFDLLTLGQLLLRLSPPGDERLVRGDTFVKQVGGAELNVAVGGALLYDHSPSARVGIYYYENGAYPRKPKVIYDRTNSSFYSLNIDEVPDEAYGIARCFLTSGITLALDESVRETAMEMIKRFKAAGTLVAFDVNFRANLWTGEEARECIERILPYVDIFFCSEDTARLTFKKTGTAKEKMYFTRRLPIRISRWWTGSAAGMPISPVLSMGFLPVTLTVRKPFDTAMPPAP